MSHLSSRFASRLLFLVAPPFFCFSPVNRQLAHPPVASTGLPGSSVQSDHSGIIIGAESVDGAGRTIAVRQAIAKGTVGSRAIAAQATTDASGAYALTGLAAGTYTVYASSRDSLEKAVATG